MSEDLIEKTRSIKEDLDYLTDYLDDAKRDIVLADLHNPDADINTTVIGVLIFALASLSKKVAKLEVNS